jgi:hypothetical protein
MAFTRSADGIAKQGKTKGKNLGDSGPSLGIQKGAKKSSGSKTVSNEALMKMGRNMARVSNQK